MRADTAPSVMIRFSASTSSTMHMSVAKVSTDPSGSLCPTSPSVDGELIDDRHTERGGDRRTGFGRELLARRRDRPRRDRESARELLARELRQLRRITHQRRRLQGVEPIHRVGDWQCRGHRHESHADRSAWPRRSRSKCTGETAMMAATTVPSAVPPAATCLAIPAPHDGRAEFGELFQPLNEHSPQTRAAARCEAHVLVEQQSRLNGRSRQVIVGAAAR